MKPFFRTLGICACLSFLSACLAPKGAVEDENVDLTTQGNSTFSPEEMQVLDRLVRGRNGVTGDQLLNF